MKILEQCSLDEVRARYIALGGVTPEPFQADADAARAERDAAVAERDAARLALAEVQAREVGLLEAAIAGRTATEHAMKILGNHGAPIAFTAHYGPKFNAACVELEAKLRVALAAPSDRTALDAMLAEARHHQTEALRGMLVGSAALVPLGDVSGFKDTLAKLLAAERAKTIEAFKAGAQPGFEATAAAVERAETAAANAQAQVMALRGALENIRSVAQATNAVFVGSVITQRIDKALATKPDVEALREFGLKVTRRCTQYDRQGEGNAAAVDAVLAGEVTP